MAYFICPECGAEDDILEYQPITITTGIRIEKCGDEYVIGYDYDGGYTPKPWANDPNSGYICAECDYELPIEKGGHDALMEYLGLPQCDAKVELEFTQHESTTPRCFGEHPPNLDPRCLLCAREGDCQKETEEGGA